MNPKCDLCIRDLIPEIHPVSRLPMNYSLYRCKHELHLYCLAQYIGKDFSRKRRLLRCPVCVKEMTSIDLYYCKLELEFLFRVHNVPWCKKKQWIISLEKQLRKMWEKEKEYIDVVFQEGAIKTT